MPPHQTPVDLIELAAAHLRTAAVDATRRGNGEAFSPWHGYAGQLELTAAGLVAHPCALPQVADQADVTTHVRLAGRALDRVPPGTGPPDLLLWIWHVAELERLAEDMAAS